MSTEVESGHTARTGRGAPTRPTLSRERIVETAIDLVDRRGLVALTMRRLGEELGVEACRCIATSTAGRTSSKASSTGWSPSCTCAPVRRSCGRPTAGRPTSAGSHTVSAH